MEAEDFAAIEQIAAANPARARELGSAWMRHMRAGEFARAWEVSDAVLRERGERSADQLPRHFQWVWNGAPLDGKRVLIRCYHGLGDTIQFIRYAPLVRQRASAVIVWAQPELLPLLRTADGIDQLLPLHHGAPEAEFDIDVESMELPHVFRSTIASLPADVPYLHVTPATLPDDGNLQVGIVWKCGDWAPERAVPVELLASLAEMRGVTLHVLQRGSGLDERPADFGVVSGSDDILAAAQTIAALDLMITIDSMPAHLAGALGVRTWILLRSECDWRWMDRGESSPWYPTVRVFRQPRAGDWAAVVAEVAADLRKLRV
ncbi:MAG: ADP-heptose--LPS heptosyltransferase [Verrucomicrobiota bacterium]|nr:ADP-heptose--LPS heptosyltransferase [Verrucomicrobiota bacterium]